MCRRFNLSSIRAYERRYGLKTVPFGLIPHYNIAPGMEVPVVVRREGQTQAVLMRWGLVPSWVKDPQPGRMLINARAETVAEKPSFSGLLGTQRCLVPANSFFEWQRQADGSKQPYNIEVADLELFSMAGLWDVWGDGIGHCFTSFTIITTEANALIRPIHDRMPVILKPEDEAEWLSAEVTDPAQLERLYRPYAADAMQRWPVSQAVNSSRQNGADLIINSQ